MMQIFDTHPDFRPSGTTVLHLTCMDENQVWKFNVSYGAHAYNCERLCTYYIVIYHNNNRVVAIYAREGHPFYDEFREAIKQCSNKTAFESHQSTVRLKKICFAFIASQMASNSELFTNFFEQILHVTYKQGYDNGEASCQNRIKSALGMLD